tara:strand:+ start:29 stop:286 length:258 start_codon:yes stop_codon:yes gene_type:complete
MRPVVRSGTPPLYFKETPMTVTVEQFLKWKILPRLMMLASTVMSWRCAEWFMSLDTPTASQSAFVSVVMGVMTGVFGIWMGHEHK